MKLNHDEDVVLNGALVYKNYSVIKFWPSSCNRLIQSRQLLRFGNVFMSIQAVRHSGRWETNPEVRQSLERKTSPQSHSCFSFDLLYSRVYITATHFRCVHFQADFNIM